MKVKLLLIEDDTFLRNLIFLSLKKVYDFDYALASNGLEAIEVLKSFSPDIIITDLSMPHMCGFDFIEEIQMNNIFKIIISGHYEKEQLFRAIKNKVDAFLCKPLDMI